MHGHESEILTTTFLMLSAVSFGLILRWLKQPPLVGYILAGLALGPAGLGLGACGAWPWGLRGLALLIIRMKFHRLPNLA
jgi:Kef-type K+ transport system membrane component KefB